MISGGFTAFQTGPGRHPGLSPQLDDLHSQFDAYPETQVCLYRCRAHAKAARDWIAKGFETPGRSTQRRYCHQKPQPPLPNHKPQFIADRDQRTVDLGCCLLRMSTSQ
jgi:hypothetical protein